MEDDSQLENAHRFSSRHKDQIMASEMCGCFYCLEIFKPQEIVEWIKEVGGNETALCPQCGIDSVIGSASGIPITSDFLRSMKQHWFDE